jgi:hypothetical protein
VFVAFEFNDRTVQVITDAVLTGARGCVASSSLSKFKRLLLKGMHDASSADTAAAATCAAVVSCWRFDSATALHSVVAVAPLLSQSGAFDSGLAAAATTEALLGCFSETIAVLGERSATQRFDYASAVCEAVREAPTVSPQLRQIGAGVLTKSVFKKKQPLVFGPLDVFHNVEQFLSCMIAAADQHFRKSPWYAPHVLSSPMPGQRLTCTPPSCSTPAGNEACRLPVDSRFFQELVIGGRGTAPWLSFGYRIA